MYVGATGPRNFRNVQMYFVCCMASVHVRDRKTQRIQVIQKDMYTYKSQKCDLYAICIGIRYGLRPLLMTLQRTKVLVGICMHDLYADVCIRLNNVSPYVFRCRQRTKYIQIV